MNDFALALERAARNSLNEGSGALNGDRMLDELMGQGIHLVSDVNLEVSGGGFPHCTSYRYSIRLDDELLNCEHQVWEDMRGREEFLVHMQRKLGFTLGSELMQRLGLGVDA